MRLSPVFSAMCVTISDFVIFFAISDPPTDRVSGRFPAARTRRGGIFGNGGGEVNLEPCAVDGAFGVPVVVMVVGGATPSSGAVSKTRRMASAQGTPAAGRGGRPGHRRPVSRVGGARRDGSVPLPGRTPAAGPRRPPRPSLGVALGFPHLQRDRERTMSIASVYILGTARPGQNVNAWQTYAPGSASPESVAHPWHSASSRHVSAQ